MIYSASETGSIEREFAKSFGMNLASAQYLIGVGRYCLARLVAPPLPNNDDVLERAIDDVVFQHDGIDKMIERRVESYPSLVWEHPELSEAVEPYVRYDVLRQIHKSRKSDLVGDEIAARCESNVRSIVEWLEMFTLIETDLFRPSSAKS